MYLLGFEDADVLQIGSKWAVNWAKGEMLAFETHLKLCGGLPGDVAWKYWGALPVNPDY
jgi:hypothetical protein